MACASGPDNRTMPIPPRPGGVAIAAMVSVVENTGNLHAARARFSALP
jgi:hypothetical protein